MNLDKKNKWYNKIQGVIDFEIKKISEKKKQKNNKN